MIATDLTLEEKRTLLKLLIKKEKAAGAGGGEQLPLSAGQKGLWYIYRIAPGSYAYNVPVAYRIKSGLDKPLFNRAINELLVRHPVLSVRFAEKEGRQFQITDPEPDIKLHEHSLEPGLEEKAVLEVLREQIRTPFNLEKEKPVSFNLYSFSPEDHILLIVVHHIVFDGMSTMVLLKDLFTSYAGLLQGETGSLPPLGSSYPDFISWQDKMLGSEEGLEHKKYWLETLRGELPILEFPADKPRALASAYSGEVAVSYLETELTLGIKKQARELSTNEYVIYLSAYIVLLFLYTGQEDILVGTPFMGRPKTEFEELIGYFVNMVVIRAFLEESMSFSELVKAVQKSVLLGLEHGDYPLSEIVKELGTGTSRGDSTIFKTAFAFQNWLKTGGEKELPIEPVQGIHQEGEFEMVFELYELADRCEVLVKYNPTLFEAESIRRIAGQYGKILEAVCADPSKRLDSISVIDSQQEQLILQDFNNTDAPFPREKLVHQLFEEQVEKNPEAPALIFEKTTLTYSQVNKKANQLAHLLRSKGVTKEVIVSVALERSPEMMIAILAILKAGGAYLPIDPHYPEARIEYMVEDSKSLLILTQERFLPLFEGRDNVLNVDNKELYKGRKTTNPSYQTTSTNLAYIIYTSGTTGKPKGTMIEHYSVINRINWMQKRYPIDSSDTILQKTPFTFDVSVWELFWWFFNASRVCFLTPGGEKNPALMVEAIRANKVTTMHFVPSMLNGFLAHLEGTEENKKLGSLRQVFASGEALHLDQVKRFNILLHETAGACLYNLYGPTEATVDVSYFDCLPENIGDKIPIGKPIDNIRLYVLDKQRKLLPVGMYGELYIAGDGLARGYLNREELTNSKFVDNPFTEGTKMYATGDLVRWMPDGNIEYAGRIDHQVKIRGFRIELGEIESKLLNHPEIKETIVLAKENNAYLCCYYVAEKELTVRELKEYLLQDLPDYMVPSYFVHLKAFPLSPNGKLDRKALPEHKTQITTGVEYCAPGTGTEKRIETIWREVLKLEKIGINDDFFDIGGDSLLSIRLIDLINRAFEIEMPMHTLITSVTIKKLAEQVDSIIGGTKESSLPDQIVQLQRGPGDGKKLFLVHPLGGDLFGFRHLLNALPGDLTVYGFQDEALLEGGAVKNSIEELAAHYIEAMEQVEPEGPYMITGLSMGGNITFEMARQLVKKGKEAPKISLIDTYIMKDEKETLDSMSEDDQDAEMMTDLLNMNRVKDGIENYVSVETFKKVKKEERFDFFMDYWGVEDRKQREVEQARFERIFNVWKKNYRANIEYNHRLYPGKVVYFRAKEVFTLDEETAAIIGETDEGKFGDTGAVEGWIELVDGGLEIVNIPGNHLTMQGPPNIRLVADKIVTLISGGDGLSS